VTPNSSQTPRVALGLPVFNGERFLAESIESALAQTFEDWALTIADNASSDRTREICEEHAARDARIRYHRNTENIGAAPNFNLCYELAPQADYFKWVASDDLMSPNFLEACVRVLDGDPSVAVALPTAVYIDGERKVVGGQRREDLGLTSDAPGARAVELMRQALEGPDVYWAIYGLMRRSALERTDLHGSYVASDQVLLFQLALLGKLVQVHEAQFLRREHEGAWTHLQDRTPEHDAVWFDSRSRGRYVRPHWTLFWNHFRSVARAHLPLPEKARSSGAVAYRAAREWRNLGGDVKVLAREVLRDIRFEARKVGRPG
jgi:glycosyltransferase involved in cell wall biosynthesis